MATHEIMHNYVINMANIDPTTTARRHVCCINVGVTQTGISIALHTYAFMCIFFCGVEGHSIDHISDIIQLAYQVDL